MSGKEFDYDCEDHIQCEHHGLAFSSVLTRREPTDQEIASYLSTRCSSLGTLLDVGGRTLLHMAVSCGRKDIALWLVHYYNADVNAKDLESGWTSLHRSLYYGQLHIAVNLMQLGASMTIPDNNNYTAIDHLIKDRFPYVEYDLRQPCEAYVWGSNSNYNLGIGNQQARSHPDLLDYFRKQNISIKKVHMDKFHSVMISSCGRVWSCGHGQGGRLGTGTESTILTPQEILLEAVATTTSNAKSGDARERCSQAAIGRDHTILLTESGTVCTFGLNTHHVLGHCPPPASVLEPRSISAKYLKTTSPIIGVCAGRFHSVLWSKEELYSFGLHGGQLGHRESQEKTVIKPKLVPPLWYPNVEYSHVAVSDGATVVVSKKTQVFLLHQYQKLRLMANVVSLEVAQVAVVGGHLDFKAHADVLCEKGDTLKVAVLSSNGAIYLWEETDTPAIKIKELILTRCVFEKHSMLDVRSIALTSNYFLLATVDGEAFFARIKPHKKENTPKQSKIFNSSFDKPKNFKARLELDGGGRRSLILERLPHVHRALDVSCDPKGHNFAVIQAHPATYLLDIPQIPPSVMQTQFLDLLNEASEGDELHDVVFQVGVRRFPAHQYILGMNSKVLLDMIKKKRESCAEGEVPLIRLDDLNNEIFELLLKYMYSGDCILFHPGPCQIILPEQEENEVAALPSSNTPIDIKDGYAISAFEVHRQSRVGQSRSAKKTVEYKPNNPVAVAKSAANRLGLFKVVKQLSFVRYDDGNIVWAKESKQPSSVSKLAFAHGELTELYDVFFKSTDGKRYGAHKCVLAARSEYFNHMLAGGWLETYSSKELSLPIHSSVLEVMFDYFYKDSTPGLDAASCEDIEFIHKALISTDQLLISGFKAHCEVALASMITLRNVATIMELAHLYNAEQLQRCCCQYVCLNLPAIFEGRCLEGISPLILELLTQYYCSEHYLVAKRVITPHANALSTDDIRKIATNHPIRWNPEEYADVDNVGALIIQKKKKQRKPRIRRDSGKGGKVRTDSVSSVNSDDLVTSGDIEPLDWSQEVEKEQYQVTLSLSKLDISAENEKQNSEKKEPWTKIQSNSKQSKIVQNRLKAAAAIKEEAPEVNVFTCLTALKSKTESVVPPPPKPHPSENAQPLPRLPDTPSVPPRPPNSEIMRKHFPELGSPDQAKSLTRSKAPANILNFSEKKVVKLSQKQRKSLVAQENAAATTSSPSPPARSWEVSGEAAASPPMNRSFADIMQEQKVGRGATTPSSPIPIQRSPVSSSPWGRLSSPGTPPTSSPGLTDIMADEQKQKDNWSRMRTKPLALTQIEDKAIEDLTNFYNAKDSSDERITVQRVINVQYALPVWVKTKH